ncbi:DUF3265 domain-containing protein [Vibrio fluvialis]
MRNAWHFYYALILVFKVLCGGIDIALLTPQQDYMEYKYGTS